MTYVEEVYKSLSEESRNREDFQSFLGIFSVGLLEKFIEKKLADSVIEILYDFSIPNNIRRLYRHLFEIGFLSYLDQVGKLPPQYSKEVFEGAVRGILEEIPYIEDHWWELVRDYQTIRNGLDAIIRAAEKNFLIRLIVKRWLGPAPKHLTVPQSKDLSELSPKSLSCLFSADPESESDLKNLPEFLEEPLLSRLLNRRRIAQEILTSEQGGEYEVSEHFSGENDPK